MPAPIYVVGTEGSVAMVAATAKTVLAVTAPAQFGIALKSLKIGFDGVTASALPVLVEIIRFTTAGTGTAVTPLQQSGRTIAHGVAATKNHTVEPTTPTLADPDMWFDPNKLALLYDWALGDEIDTAVSEGLGLRVTAPAVVNVRAQFRWNRI